jgi:hypothetical protein
MRRRPALVGAAVLCFATAGLLQSVAADATSAPGAAFLGYTLRAQGSGLQLTEDEPTATSHPEAEGEVPHSQVSLVSGPVGYALSSVAWPGALVANAGSLLVLAGAPVPPDVAQQLNDPVRAETRTGGPSSVTNDSVPGAVMHASVAPGKAAADSFVDGGEAGTTTGFGKTSTSSSAVLAASSATTTADSAAKDVSLAGGVVTLRSVVSHATATTDGEVATASGSTVVSGLEVAGVPVTVDDHGVTVNGTTTPVDPTLAETVNTALSQLNMRIALSSPSSSRQDGSVSYDAGSLIVSWTPPQSANLFTAALGGARVLAAASPTDPAAQGEPAPPGTPSGVPGGSGGDVGAPAPLPALGGPPATGTADPPVAAAPAGAPAPGPLLSGTTTPASTITLCVLGALLLLGGLLRVPSTVLVPAPNRACPSGRSDDDG